MNFLVKCVSYIMIMAQMTFLFSGCGKQDNSKGVLMWLVGSEAQAKTIIELSKSFTEKTGITVDCQAISWGDAHSKYLTSIAGGITPDIGTMGLTWGMEFGELGALVDIKKCFPEDVEELEKKNFPGIVESTKIGDKVYGVPLDMSEHIMYYRTDIISAPPKTWEELVKTLRDLKSQNRGMVFDWGSLDWIGFAPFLWQAGASFYDNTYANVTVDSPEAARALDFFAGLYKEGVPKTTVPLEQGMRTGDFPLAISGNWKIISLSLGAPEIAGKWSIAMLPKGPSGKQTAFIGGRIMSIFTNSKHQKEAWEFIKFLSTPEIQVKLYEASLDTEDSYLPPNMDTWKKLKMDNQFKKVLESQALDAKGPPPVIGWDSSTRFINEAIQMVILKNANSMEELKKAAKSMTAEMRKE